MLFARIAHPDDERVVEHRAVAFLHRVEPAGEVGDPLGVERANRDAELVALSGCVRMHVADRMAVRHHAEFLPGVDTPMPPDASIVHHIRQPRRNRRRRDRTLGLEPLGRRVGC